MPGLVAVAPVAPVDARPTVAPLSPTDAAAVEALAGQLSARSLYQRFFTGTPRIPAGELRLLARIDHDTVEAVGAHAEGRLIGWAEYVVVGAGTAEIAVTVVDAWQHRGVGRQLFLALRDLARDRGIERFAASTLSDNHAARSALDRWPGAVRSRDGVAFDYLLPLAGDRGAA